MVDDNGFTTPEEAALEDFPRRYARVERVEYSHEKRRAKVHLLTNEEPTLYPYYVYCTRDERGRWHEEYSAN